MEKSEEKADGNIVSLQEAYVNLEDKILDPTKIDLSMLERMPTPTGWRLLILPYRGKGKTEGGILLPDAVIDRESLATVCGFVLKLGPLAYEDKEKFPGGAWCQEKVWVIFS